MVILSFLYCVIWISNSVGETSAGFGKSSLKHTKSSRIILSCQKLALVLTSTPEAIAWTDTPCYLATSGKKTAGSVLPTKLLSLYFFLHQQEAIAYFPLMILISGILMTGVVKRLNRYFSNRVGLNMCLCVKIQILLTGLLTFVIAQVGIIYILKPGADFRAHR